MDPDFNPDSKKYSHIFWDWNGTLLDDTRYCVEINNRMLSARGMRLIQGVEEYRGMFFFPVMEYYRAIGFDFEQETFDALAREYNAVYYSNDGYALHRGAEDVIAAIRGRGIRQIILSASEKNNLLSQVGRFPIAAYFDGILGVSDIYGNSKVELALDYIARNHIDKALFIGDTAHDYETARAIGADCVLISNGHQSPERLSACGVPVLNDITGVIAYIDRGY